LSALGFNAFENPFGIVRSIYACPKLKQNNYAFLCKSYNSIAGWIKVGLGTRPLLSGLIFQFTGNRWSEPFFEPKYVSYPFLKSLDPLMIEGPGGSMS